MRKVKWQGQAKSKAGHCGSSISSVNKIPWRGNLPDKEKAEIEEKSRSFGGGFFLRRGQKTQPSVYRFRIVKKPIDLVRFIMKNIPQIRPKVKYFGHPALWDKLFSAYCATC
ncbi:MAG: hypothetical protein E7654_03020 [Ruminococcaceae bacterium]|nr:hypothetical protein [Oscillospiraceae bacterium]